jgi:hypothetical protein
MTFSAQILPRRSRLAALLDHFSHVEDPRDVRRILHPLPEVLRAFRQRLRLFGQNAFLAEKVVGRTAFHQLVQQVFVDAHTWISLQSSYHARAQNS